MLIRRNTRTGSDDLHVVYRPYKIAEMLGHVTNKKIIKNSLDNKTVSHTNLFTGPYGCGKTTAARILAASLNCDEGMSSEPCLKCESCLSIINNHSMDVIEVNLGQSGRKGDVSDLVKDLGAAAFFSNYKVLIMDEAQDLTKASQDLLLKVIEDGYSHVYFIFCTNEPEKLKDTFISRCNVLHFGRMSVENILAMLTNVCEFEGIDYDKDVVSYLADEAKGVPRDALISLKQVIDEGSWTIEAIKKLGGIILDENDPQVIELSRALFKGSFKDALGIYKKLNVAPESLRIAVAGYFIGCLKRIRKVGEGRKYDKVMDVMGKPIYESGKLAEHAMIHRLFKVTDAVNTYNAGQTRSN